MTRLTLYIGSVALVDATIQAALALSLSTSAFLVATTPSDAEVSRADFLARSVMQMRRQTP